MLPRSETRGHETFSSTNVFTTSVGTQPGRKEAGVPKTVSEQTERLKRHWEKEAPTYDRRRAFSRGCSSETVGSGCAHEPPARCWRWPWGRDVTSPSTPKGCGSPA